MQQIPAKTRVVPFLAGALALVLAVTALPRPALPDSLEPPATRLERGATARFVYRMDHPGAGVLTLDWTDAYGREIEHRVVPVPATGGRAVPLPLDLARVVATANSLHARLDRAGRISEASLAFTVPPPEDGWADWRNIMWQPQDPVRLAGLRRQAITAIRVQGSRNGLTEADAEHAMAPLLATGLTPFIENIATDFYAPYHRYQPGKSVTWLFDETRRRYRENPADPTVRMREPSLSDPAWQASINARLARHVRIYARYRPLYYNLGDESGIADLAANWDFDFSPASLAAMRVWLRTQYPSLAALNQQWGSAFPSWNAVLPPTTGATLARKDANYSAWGDFKEWMDIAFARALRSGTETIHAVDKHARSAIEGAQGPGWGGYNYTKLARAVDVLEAYEGQNNVEIALSLNPALISLTTSFEGSPREVHRVWREALLGQRGLVLWDEDHGFVAEDGGPGPRGRAMEGVFNELTSGIGAQLIASERQRDPVAVLYSPASFRLRWLLDRKAETTPWTERDSERESFDNDFRAAMRRAGSLLHHAGLQPSWLSPELLAGGALEKLGIRVLVLAHVLALAPAEAAAVRRFVHGGGVVLADVPPGEFDGHGRRLARPALADLGGSIRLAGELSHDDAPTSVFTQALADAGVAAAFTMTAPDGTQLHDVQARLFRNGAVRIIGLQRDAPAKGAFGNPLAAMLRLKQAEWRTDMRAPGAATRADAFALTLDPVTPTLLVIAPTRLPAPVIAGPTQARPGEIASFSLGLAGPSPAARHILHVEALDPSGRNVTHYAANLALTVRRTGAKTTWRLPLALNDTPGRWTIRVRDMLGGGEVSWPLEVAP